MKSAFQSLRSAASELAFTQFGKNCRPWLLMPRSWIAVPDWLHRCTPQTLSWPLTATGEPAGAFAPGWAGAGAWVVGVATGAAEAGTGGLVGGLVGAAPGADTLFSLQADRPSAFRLGLGALRPMAV